LKFGSGLVLCGLGVERVGGGTGGGTRRAKRGSGLQEVDVQDEPRGMLRARALGRLQVRAVWSIETGGIAQLRMMPPRRSCRWERPQGKRVVVARWRIVRDGRAPALPGEHRVNRARACTGGPVRVSETASAFAHT
jgi:hypothetical protein